MVDIALWRDKTQENTNLLEKQNGGKRLGYPLIALNYASP